MDKYNDMFESNHSWTEAKGKDPQFLGTLVFSWGRSDVFNKNHRYYPHKTFTAAVSELNTRIKKANVPGQVDHPLGGGSTRLSDVSHILTKAWMDDKKIAWARASILDTQKGRDTLQIIKSGVAIGASLRGFGEVDKEGKVKPGLQVKTVDLVVDPSFGAAARVDQSSVIESYIPEDEDEGWNEESLEQLTEAMDGLSNGTIALIVEKLEKTENIKMTPERVKGLILWIKCSKTDPGILPFHEWFLEQQEKLGATNSNFKEELNDGLRKQANFRNEERMAGTSRSVNTMFMGRKQIQQRQKEVDAALEGKTMTEKTVSRLYAEYILAGGHLSRSAWIEEFGF